MPMEDDDRPRKKITHEIGQDLYLLSLEELTERIALLTAEIARLQEAATKKRASKDAASAFFKTDLSLRGAKRRSNPDCPRGGSLDCFASLAMTEEHSANGRHG